MKKAAGQLCLIWKGVLCIGFSLQIFLGVVWICLHFGGVQQFARIETGIYPLFVRALGRFPQTLYLLQLAAAWGAGWLFLGPLCPGRGFRRVWCVLALLTLPVAMQCHLALLPYSFVSSLVLLELHFCGGMRDREKGPTVRKLVKSGACWLGLALLLPEYGWLGGIPLALILLFRWNTFRGRLRQLLYCCLVLAALSGVVGGTQSLLRAGGVYGSQRNFWFSMASRTAWPTLWNDSRQWPEELQEVTREVVMESSLVPGNMERVLAPGLEQAVGTDEAERYYREMSKQAWSLHRNQILKQAAWDMLTYCAPEAVLQLQLTGRAYDSASGRNYEIMWRRHPLLTKYVVNYGCWWFWVSLGTAALLILCRYVAGERPESGPYLVFWAHVALWMAAVILFYTLRGAGIADYKYTVAAAELWIVLALSCVGAESRSVTESVAE